MASQPLVSVITIFLNEELYLESAIASLLAQTYAHWELLLVDDGSSDQSSAIAQTYAQQYPEQIRYLEHEGHQNRGMSASRNLGIQQAQGEYVAFLDGDDVWLPRKLEQQVAILQTHLEAGFVSGQAEWWYSWSGNPEDAQRDFVQRLHVPLNTLIHPPQLLLLFLQDEWASLCDVMVRREILEAIGGYEESFRGMYEDQAFHTKLCLNYPAFIASDCWYRYRQHPQSCCYQADDTKSWSKARHTFLNWLEAYLIQQDRHEPELWQVLQREMWPFRHPQLARFVNRTRRVKVRLKQTAKQVLPSSIQDQLKTLRRSWRSQWRKLRCSPPVGWVRWGSLRRVTPISRDFGFDRGLPVDRYYIEQFLTDRAPDVQGRVLELGDDTYTRRFGGDRVTQADVLHSPIGEIGPLITIVADLTDASHIPSDAFDCIILTQTLLFIYDLRAAIQTLHRILKPNGVLLVTLPGISPIIRADMELWGEYWRFTRQSAERLFGEVFPHVEVKTYGNVMSASAFLYGLAAAELRPSERDACDPDYEVIITVRALKTPQPPNA